MACAVRWLAVSWNRVGRSIGMSAGHAPLQDAIDIAGGTARQVVQLGAVAEQEAAVREQRKVGHRRQAPFDRQLGDALALVEDEAHRIGQQRLRLSGGGCLESRLDILCTPHRQP